MHISCSVRIGVVYTSGEDLGSCHIVMSMSMVGAKEMYELNDEGRAKPSNVSVRKV